ncbi:hypothetical protein [Hahella chejuensis]|uniref:hypothetical protein n=1 Tax=Hahella chejuensis TaxID=158327 RepID=UPI0011D0E0A3|nr:hypothetical protein [Hahella chejuensis]
MLDDSSLQRFKEHCPGFRHYHALYELDEQKAAQRTEAKGSPLTNEELNSCLRPVGEGFETFTPNGSCSTVA